MMHKTERGNRLLTEGCVYFIPDGHSHALEPDPGLIVRNLYLLPKIFLSDASEESTPVMLQDFLLYFTDPGLRQTAEIRLPQDQLTAVRSLLEACDTPPCCDLLSDAFRYHCLMNVLLLLCDSFGPGLPGMSRTQGRPVFTVFYGSSGKIFPFPQGICCAPSPLSFS